MNNILRPTLELTVIIPAMQSKRHVRHDMICAIIFFSYPQWLKPEI